jgi:prepilin-type N-terminal cleavage/methylation domain-containing protein
MEMYERKGFTLIEILIVVAIIAILASIVLVGLGPTQQSGRDARRLSDLHEDQNGIELYYSKCGYYPGTAQAGACGAFATAINYAGMATAVQGSGVGVSVMPNDPTAGDSYYYAATAGGADYMLMAKLENLNNSVFTTYTAPNPAGYTFGDSLIVPDCTAAGKAAGYYCITL